MSKLIPLLLALLANAVGLSEDLRDPASWVLSTGALAAVVWATVKFLRANILKKLDGVAVIFTSIGVGAALSVALGAGGYAGLGAGVVEWLAFGVSAGFGATLIDQGAKVLPKPGAARLEE